MTILWDLEPGAAELTYRFALGGDVEQLVNGPRILRALQEDPSHRLIVIGSDIDLEEACGLAEEVRIDRPEIGVILLRHRLDVTALAQALRSGVREVVTAGDHMALAEAVRRSRELTAHLSGHASAGGRGAEGRVVTVFSAKGGVGKTTLATNLGAYLATTGARVLLIDLDLMFGDVAISLQLEPRGSLRDIAAMSGRLDDKGVDSVVIQHEPSGLDVIAAPIDPGDAERIASSVVVELLRVARTIYDYIVVDTPPSFTEHVLAAIDLSDLTVLIATLEIPSVKNLRIAISTLDTLGAAPDARAIVLNRADVRVGLKASDVEAALREPIAASIPNSVSVPSATNRGVAIVIEEPKSPVALAIREVADREIRQRFGEVPQNGTRRSFSLMRSKK